MLSPLANRSTRITIGLMAATIGAALWPTILDGTLIPICHVTQDRPYLRQAARP